MPRSTLLLYQETNSYQLRCRPTNSPGCCPGQQLMNTRETNNPVRHFSSDKQVDTGMIMMMLGCWCMYVYITAGKSLCGSLLVHLCGLLYVVCCQVCLFVCILCSVKAYTSQVFAGFNDWTLGTTGVYVPWDLLLSTKRVKGMKLTFAFQPDSRWTANQGFILLSLLSWYNDVLTKIYHRALLHTVDFSILHFIFSHLFL